MADTKITAEKVVNKKLELQIIENEKTLRADIIKVSKKLTNTILRDFSVVKNAYDQQSDIISKDEKDSYKAEIAVVLALFFGIVIYNIGKANMIKRIKDLGLTSNFSIDKETKKYINDISTKVADGYTSTIINDILNAIKQEYDALLADALKEITGDTARKVTDADLIKARKLALSGKSQAQITKAIKETYNTRISTIRAKAIARTETNRAFTVAQYQSDKQFLTQNDIMDKAYKQWVTTSDNPCPTCVDLSHKDPIPFENNFANLGDEIVTTYEDKGVMKVKRLLVDFQPLEAGNAHVNCGCHYQLVIKDKGFKTYNSIVIDWFYVYNYNKEHDSEGKFASTTGSGGGTDKAKTEYINKRAKYYHGSPYASKIEESGFNLDNLGKGSGSVGNFGAGINLTNNKARAGDYGKVIKAGIAKDAKMYRITDPNKITTELMGGDTNYGDPFLITKKFQNKGYDGLIIGNKDLDIVVFNPKKALTTKQIGLEYDKLHKKNNIEDKVDNFNPNHGDDGKFSKGIGTPSTPTDGAGKSLDEYQFEVDSQKTSPDVMKQFTQQSKTELTQREQDAITTYTDTGHASINGLLRHNKPSVYGKEIPYIDDAIAKSSLPHDAIVYRGAEFDNPADISKIISSGKFTDKGFVSTSLDHKVAINDFKSQKQGSVLFAISVSKGDNGLYVDNSIGFPKNEKEIILPRGNTFSVIYDTTRNIDGKTVKMIGLE